MSKKKKEVLEAKIMTSSSFEFEFKIKPDGCLHSFKILDMPDMPDVTDANLFESGNGWSFKVGKSLTGEHMINTAAKLVYFNIKPNDKPFVFKEKSFNVKDGEEFIAACEEYLKDCDELVSFGTEMDDKLDKATKQITSSEEDDEEEDLDIGFGSEPEPEPETEPNTKQKESKEKTMPEPEKPKIKRRRRPATSKPAMSMDELVNLKNNVRDFVYHNGCQDMNLRQANIINDKIFDIMENWKEHSKEEVE